MTHEPHPRAGTVDGTTDRSGEVPLIREGPPAILVVDDNALNAKLLRMALEAQGYAVRIADRVATAREQLRAAAPLVLLLDVQLPEADGLTLLREVRADERRRRLPVVVVSAFAAGDDLDRAYAAGADAFLPKPINVKSLLRIVERFVAER